MKNKARAIIAFVEDTCSEFGYQAYSAYEEFGFSLTSKETDREIKVMKEHGVHDIGGSLADNMYNHVGFCEDMLGDRIYEEAKSDLEIVSLAEEVKKQSTNQAMKQACDNIIRRWKKQACDSIIRRWKNV